MRLAVAVAVSVLVHAAVVAVSWTRRSEAAAAVTMSEPTPIQIVDVPPLPRRGEGRGEGRAPSEKKAVRRKPEAPRPAVVAAEEAAPQPEPVAEMVVEETAGGPPAPVAPATGRVFDVSSIHAALEASARRCYPAAAKRYRLTGEAQVELCLDASGGLRSTKLIASSGESMLDAAARDCVVAGALPLPAEAAGGCFAVPVRFAGH